LADEGFIRGYSETQIDGFRAFEVELKYFEGEAAFTRLLKHSRKSAMAWVLLSSQRQKAL